MSSVFNEIEREVRDVLQPLKDIVTAGNVSDFAQYKDLAGQIKGMERCLDITRDVLSRLQRQTDVD